MVTFKRVIATPARITVRPRSRKRWTWKKLKKKKIRETFKRVIVTREAEVLETWDLEKFQIKRVLVTPAVYP